MQSIIRFTLSTILVAATLVFGQAGGGPPEKTAGQQVFLSPKKTFDAQTETFFYSTTTYTFTDLVVFSYFDQSSFYVLDQLGNKVDSVALDNNQYYVFSTGEGVFTVECTESFSVLVGDPVSRNVLGYYAVDESGSPLSTRLNTYMPEHYTTGEHFIVFGYHDGTDFIIRNLQTGMVVTAGVLNTGEHFELNDYYSAFLGVEASKPVSALSYTDQGYFIPATNGTFAGTTFYGYAGYVGGWPNGIIVTGYQDSTYFVVSDALTGATIDSGYVSTGEAHAFSVFEDTYYVLTADNKVTVCNTPYAYYSGSYYYMTRQIDESGLGIGTNFYAPVVSGQFDVFSFADSNEVMITAMSSGSLIWSGTLNRNENYSFSSYKEVYHVEASENVSVISSWGGSWGADFVPLNFALTLPDLAVSSNDIEFLPEKETRIAGEPVTLKATIRNQGFETAEVIYVRFYDGDPDAGVDISPTFTIGELAPGAEQVVEFNWTVPDYAEYHNIYVQVDRSNFIRESNESNNTALRSLIPNNDLLPPLSTVVEAPVKVTVDDQNNPEFDVFTVSVDLFNTGTLAAKNTRAILNLPVELQLADSLTRTVHWDSVSAAAHVDTSWQVKIVSIPGGDAIFYSVVVEADSIESKTVERMLSLHRPTSLEDKNVTKGPEAFILSQNYPNPFNPSTQVRLEIQHTAALELDVYDIQGKHVSSVAKGKYAPGTYRFTFDGSDQVSGIYFMVLKIDGFRAGVRKMMLVK